ncbi:hypothetical protein SAMN05519103_08863 [Rhizobiales bacterium GAS113]|nr:hypothetical protein SAMN05519103_08863 [Rhizobiales bacterium GAS113]
MQSDDIVEVVTPLGGGISEVTLFPADDVLGLVRYVKSSAKNRGTTADWRGGR